MKRQNGKHLKATCCAVAMLAVILWSLPSAFARDTDIYAVNAKQNCYILLDSSHSMGFGVYEQGVDYGAMFDYLITLNDTGTPIPNNTYIWDTINNSAYFYHNHQQSNKIYLWKGQIGLTIATVNGQTVAFTGDAADPDYLWYTDQLVDTHTVIDANGNLADDGTGLRRLTIDANGHVLLDNAVLPLNQDLKLHDLQTLYDGSQVDNGFGGLLTAPGYYFSGYKGVTQGSLQVATTGTTNIFFFVTGNWVNMQAMYNLHYTTNNPTPTGAQQGDPAWKFELFPLGWSTLSQTLKYPSSGATYNNNLTENTTKQTITHPGAQKIKVHFSAFDVQGDGAAGTFTKDYVKIYQKDGVTLVATYDNDNNPTSGDGWSPEIPGDSAVIKLYSDASIKGAGYAIDKIAVVYQVDASGVPSYLMQTRLDVAKDALTYVVDQFRGKMNWGFASFKDDGAQLGPYLNPTDNDDTQRAAIVQAVNGITLPALGPDKTPLMGALEDVFEQGYYGRRNVLSNLLCRKNYVISVTDGFPSWDTNNTKIGGVTFADFDGDGWTSDPYQPPVTPNYYDDVAHWMYTHSWLDKSLVTDPANSYVNVITHHIAFGAKQPLLQDAASESGGQYITAYNKEQLVAAFYSLALQMTQTVSFTAPVVSVDAVNKTQDGDDLYMGQFLPMDSSNWVGNVKKYKLGDGSTARPNLWMIYDAANHEAIDSTGTFLDNPTPFWGHNQPSPNQIQQDGAGEQLLEDVKAFFSAGTYWNRAIYTYKNSAMTKFDRTNITPADLSVADAATRDMLVNFTHGYTYAANATTGAPLAVRSWSLGPIIHSRPVVVDYYDTTAPGLPLLQRMVAVGANDGMLHVFDDTTGKEIFAFIPDDILPHLKDVQANKMYDTVDGFVTLYRRDKNPKYLIFGERRGGGVYWCLDVHDQNPLNWTVAWKYTNPEISQTWSEVRVASLPVGITTNGQRTYKDVAVFTGGYDVLEDSFPEPFNDADGNGTPYKADGTTLDTTEWNKNDATQDLNGNKLYDKYNPGTDVSGRGIFVVDIDNPAATTPDPLDASKNILPFSATYGTTGNTTGNAQTFTGMKFCFPATPSMATGTDKYAYQNGAVLATGIKANVFQLIYAIDIYADLFKLNYDFETINNGTTASPNWAVTSAAWNVQKIFAGNPGSLSGSGNIGQGADAADQGRKAFYAPSISWGGAGSYFDAKNYVYPNVTFSGRDKIASLFFGTGDREHPKYTMIRNRFYAIYDDSSVTAKQYAVDGTFLQNIAVSSVPYTEDKLLNVTCDELGIDSIITNCYLGTLGGVCDPADTVADINLVMKNYLKARLTDDATYGSGTPLLENGAAHEDDAKGWYIVLADQGNSAVCGGHVQYPSTITAATTNDRDNHIGEQVLSQSTLYAGVLYFTSYQPSIADPCNPQGNGFNYALDYTTGSAALNLNTAGATTTKDVTDRYFKYVGIFGIPSGFAIITRNGEAAAMASMGGSIIGGGESTGGGTPPYQIKGAGAGLDLYYWRDSNSLE